MMYEHIIVVGNSLEGVLEAIGPFTFEMDADDWLKENPVDSTMNAKIIFLTTPDPDPYHES